MSKEELDMMEEALEEYWSKWVQLVNETVDACNDQSDEFIGLLMTRMQEKATVYGAVK